MIAAKLITSGLEAAMEKYAEHVKTSVVRAGTQAAAQVFYDEARQRVPVSKHAHFFYGSSAKKANKGMKQMHAYYYSPGNLRNSIYQVFSKSESANGKATYHISWNKSEAPYGYMVEYGTSHSAAKPFLAPAYEAKQADAYQAARDKMKDML